MEKKKIKRTGVYLDSMINKILYCSISFFSNILITRYLGVELKGNYTYIINTANMLSILLGMGIYHSIPFYNRQNNDKEQTLLEYVNIFVFQGIFYTIICTIVGIFVPGLSIKLILLLTVLDNITKELNMLMLVRDVRKRNRIFLRGAIINILCNGIAYMFIEKSIIVAIIIMTLVKCYYLISYLFSIKQPINICNLNIHNILKFIKFGYLPMISFLLITINYKMDVVMLEWMPQIDNTQLSYYSLGVTVADIAWIVSDVFKDVIFSKTATGNHYKEIISALRVSNAFMCIIVIGLILFGKIFIRIFYGYEFIYSYDVTVLLFLGVPLMSWFKILHPLFNAQGRRRFSFCTLLIAAITNILLNFVMIPIWGINGAAIASVVSYTVCGVVYLIRFSKDAQISFFRLFLPRKEDFIMIFVEK